MKKYHYIKLIIVILVLLLRFPLIYSQDYAKNWLFGKFGLEFGSDTVIVRHDYALHENRGIGIISDNAGNLLCYTDGINIWNKNHTIMPNGHNLLPKQIFKSIIIPKPSVESECYVFTVEAYNGQNSAGLYYSIVNLDLDNGLGDVTLRAKKILDKTTNHITAVYHKNGYDVWIITHQHNTNKFYAYLLSETGLDEAPVVSSVGQPFPYIPSFDGQLKASPDGNKIACSYMGSPDDKGVFSLFDFDNSTGKLTNPLLFGVPVTDRSCDGLEFSPDAKKIFVYQTGSIGEDGIYQFDISSGNYTTINDSRILLFKPRDNELMQMQLTPNGKIYITKGGGQHSGTLYLGVIENPNEWGSTVKEFGLYLDGSTAFTAQTPNFIQNYFFKTSFTFSDVCSGNPTYFKITNELGLESVKWDFGQGESSTERQPQFTYNEAGEYTVTLEAYYKNRTDIIKRKVNINSSPKLNLGNDATVCSGYEISAPEGFKSYNWNTGNNTRSIIIKESGRYKLTVENEYGCQTSDSVNMNVTEHPTIDLSDSIQLGILEYISVSPGNFKSYYWSSGETTPSINIKNEGWYSVTVENEAGCTATKSFYVYTDRQTTDNFDDWQILNPLPSISAGLDIYFLDNQTGYILNEGQVLGTSDGGVAWSVLTKITFGKHMQFKDNYGYIIGGNGVIYKSTYMGGGWNKLNAGLTGDITGLSVVSKDSVFVTSSNKLYFSFDGGKNWDMADVPGNFMTYSYFTSSKVGYIGFSNGNVYKTIDGGKIWSLKSSINSSSSNINKMYFVDRNTGFISRGYTGTILKTTDAGETWKETTGTTDNINTFFFLDSQNGFVAGEYGVIFKTSDGGSTWSWIGFQNGRYSGTDIYGLYFKDKMTGFAVGMGGRIMKTTDGGTTWNAYAVTYNTIKQLKSVSNTTTYGLAGNLFIKTTDGGSTWTNMGAPLSTANTRQFDFINENIGYCIAGGHINSSANVGKVFKTIDGGKTWAATNGGIDIVYDNLYSIDFIDENTGFVSGGYYRKGTFKTSDGGNTWKEVNDYSLEQIQFINSSVGYARNVDNYYNRIYKTIDGGENWTSTFETDKNITSFHFLDEMIGFFVGNSGLMYKTADGGVTWEKITVPYANYINIKFHSPNTGYISDNYGVSYQTNNGGASWVKLDKPYRVTGIELFDNEIYAFGGGGVIMKKKIDCDPVALTLYTASDITNTSVTLSGNVASDNGMIKNIHFEYGINSLSNKLVIQADPAQSNTNVNISVSLKDLQPNQTYNFRLSAMVDDKPYSSDILQFTTLPDYEMIMNSVYDVTPTDVNIIGYVISNASEIKDIEFQYGTDEMFKYKTIAQPHAVAGGTTQTISGRLTSLEPQTRYYVRIKGNYKDSEIFSAPVSFTTLSTHTITIYNPYVIADNVAFDIFISANKDNIQNIVFEYGTTREYKNQVNISGQVAKGSYNYFFTQLTELDPATVYYYRVSANMGTETIYSSENILKLDGRVVIIPIESKQLSDNSMQLQGLVNANGNVISNIYFQYGLTENLGDSIMAIPYYIFGSETNLVSATLSNLTPNVKYYGQITATDNSNRYYSEIFTFCEQITGVNSIDNKSIMIYPNPTADFIYIQSTLPINRVEIYDISGKLILATGNRSEIDISQLANGIYFVRIFLDKKFITKKIIKH